MEIYCKLYNSPPHPSECPYLNRDWFPIFSGYICLWEGVVEKITQVDFLARVSKFFCMFLKGVQLILQHHPDPILPTLLPVRWAEGMLSQQNQGREEWGGLQVCQDADDNSVLVPPEFSTALHLEPFEVLPVSGSTDLEGSSVLQAALSTKDICKELNLLRTVGRR